MQCVVPFKKMPNLFKFGFSSSGSKTKSEKSSDKLQKSSDSAKKKSTKPTKGKEHIYQVGKMIMTG